MNQPDFHQEFEVAQKVILEASEIALSYFEKSFTSEYKDDLPSSIVTQADKEAEALIRKTVESQFPTHGFIGEESEENNKETAWVVDPIDGTLAFSRGLPEFGMTIALKDKDQVVFSVMYLPYFKKLYKAYISEGAFMNDKKISVSDVTSLNQAIISVHERGAHKPYYKDYAHVVTEKFTVRMTHSAVVESCYLSEGKIDALLKFDQKIWDLAPEYRLMEEAGAKITDEHGKHFNFVFSKDSKQTYLAITSSIPEDEQKALYFS